MELLEPIVELFGEALAWLVLQILGLLGSHALEPYRSSRPRSPTASIISHLFFGAVLGGLSLIVWRQSMIQSDLARVAYLFLAPIAAGGFSAGIGWLLRKWGKDTVPLERFGYAYLFAFSGSAVRFLATL